MITDQDYLVQNLDKIHTTEMGYNRICKNIELIDTDVINWCKNAICSKNSSVVRKGKNFYITFGITIITVNANSFTIITAHKK